MKRSGSKEQAESILQELPSVLAAYVREDIEGNPREIHLLVAPGPDVRHLARDIRGLLEERLGVPIDQRIISIAQISEQAPESPVLAAAAAAAGPAGASQTESPPQPAEHLAEPPTDAEGGAETAMATAAPASAAEPRLVYDGIDCWTSDGRAVARVRLTWQGEAFESEARDIDTQPGRVRAAAAATMQAAAAACRGTMDFQIEGASVVRVFDREIALVSAVAASPVLGRRPLPLVGAHPLNSDFEEAAVLAALKAIARVVVLGLRAGRGT